MTQDICAWNFMGLTGFVADAISSDYYVCILKYLWTENSQLSKVDSRYNVHKRKAFDYENLLKIIMQWWVCFSAYFVCHSTQLYHFAEYSLANGIFEPHRKKKFICKKIKLPGEINIAIKQKRPQKKLFCASTEYYIKVCLQVKI